VYGWLNEGDKVFGDDKYGISVLPAGLFGSTVLQYRKEDRPPEMVFDLAVAADVFLGIRDPLTAEWKMDGYEDLRQQIKLADGSVYNVWRKRFGAGRVVLSTAAVPVILIQPAVDMQPAYDLKPVVSYKGNIAAVSGEMQKMQFDKRDVAMATGAGLARAEWPVSTGVADIYSLTVKYHWGNEQPVNGTIELIGPGNSRMTTQALIFTFTRPGKWNTITINTGTMINAGNYIVRIVTEKAKGLAISGIDVQ
jgi:hypothetical protein